MQDHKELTIRGIKWNLIEQLLVYAFVFLGTVVLSRILLPEEFGLFGMLTVLGNLATLIVGMGLSYSVINNQDLTKHDLSTIFWFNLLLGSLVAILFFVLAPFIASFYHQSELTNITRIFCLGFIVQGANAVPQGLLIRRMNFKKLAFSNIAAAGIAFTISIFIAISGLGVWALVAHFLFLNTVMVLLNFIFCSWIPICSFRISALKKIARFSTNLFGSQLIDFSANNLDVVLIGKYLGKRDLGFFGRASALVIIPVTSIGYVLNRTFFPWFSALQSNPEELKLRYWQALRVLITTVVPLIFLIGILSEDIVLILFGPQWVPISFMVSILSIFALVQCFNAFHDSFLISQKRSDILLRVSLVEKTLLIIGVIVGLKFGLLGILWAKVSVLLIIFIPRVFLICTVIQIRPIMWFAKLNVLWLALVILVVTSVLTKYFLTEALYYIRVFLVVFSGLAMFFLFLYLVNEQSLSDLRKFFLSFFEKLRK